MFTRGVGASFVATLLYVDEIIVAGPSNNVNRQNQSFLALQV